MIYLISGANGAGKTLYTISELPKIKAFQGREIFYHGIPLTDLGHSQLGWVKFDDVTKWHELPENSVIIIDEAWKHFEYVTGKKPDYYNYMRDHRNRGYDIWIICQRPVEIDSAIRGRVYKHTHLSPMKIGSTNAEAFTLDNQCLDVDPNGKIVDKFKATKSLFTYKKKYYEYYISTTLNTKQFRFPKGLYIGMPAAILLFSMVYYLFNAVPKAVYRNFEEPVIESTNDDPYLSKTVLTETNYKPVESKNIWDMWIPRMERMPMSAPIYDPIMVNVSSAPIPENCISNQHKCLCYTNQGTRVKTTDAYCRQTIDEGYFDPYKTKVVINGS